MARVALGLVLAWFLVGYARGYEAVAQPGNLALYLVALFAVVWLPFGTRRGRAVVAAVLVVAAVAADYALFGQWWGWPLAVLLYGGGLLFVAILVPSLIAAGIAGYLGCEMTALPNLLLRRQDPVVER